MFQYLGKSANDILKWTAY